MLKRYKILTVSHRKTSLKELGGFVMENGEENTLKDQLSEIKSRFGFNELFYMATCNRVMYLWDSEKDFSTEEIHSLFQYSNKKLTNEKISENVIFLEGVHALNHLFEVAASIDSMVVGEREILRQLRDAYGLCKEWGLTGDHLRLAFKHTVQTAKLVYAKTRIGEKPVSVVSLAIKTMLQKQVPVDARILLVGAGQTNGLAAKFLKKHKFTDVTIFNRSLDKAERLASMLSGTALPLSNLEEYRRGFDVMITCTGTTESWIDNDLYSKLLNKEEGQKLIIDLAIPNNISTEVIENFDVDYIEIDALKNLAEKNKAFRTKEVFAAREILIKELRDFGSHFQERQIEKAMHSVPTEIKAIKQHAMNQVFKKELDGLDDNARDLMERMLTYMEKQCISIPMKAAKKAVM